MTNLNQDSPQTSAQPATDGSRRRRFLGAGLSAAPVVLTMVSQPALGGTCFSPSQALSKNTSLSRPRPQCLGAQSPGNYKAQTTNWPSSVKPTDKFHDTFAKGSNANFRRKTFQEVLDLTQGEDKSKTAFHVIGAYLNILGGSGAVIPPEVLTVATLKEVWRQYAVNGFYLPIPGGSIKWYGDDIVQYLKTNDIVA